MQHQGPIAGIAAHAGFIATAGYDNRIVLWDGARREAIARASHDHLVNHCAFSADGRWLVSASSDYSARVWSLPMLRLHAVLADHGDDVDMALFSPDDERIATCALDRVVRIFDRAGRCLHAMRGHGGNVLSLAWSADGRRLVSSSVDGTIREWDADRGVELRATDLQVRTDSVELGTDGCVWAGDDRGRIAVIREGRARLVEAHRAGIKKIVLDERRRRLVTLSYDRALALWALDDAGLPHELARSALPESVWARAATLLDDGRIACGTFGSTYALFDPASAAWDLQGVAAGGAINAVLHARGRCYTVGDAGTVECDGRAVAEMGSLCNFLAEAGGRLFTGGQLGQLFDAESGALLHEHHSPLNCATGFLRGGRAHLAVGSYTGEILVFALASGGALEPVREIAVYENAVKGLSFADGLLFSVCASTDIAWHEIEGWTPVQRVARAHERIANACCAIGEGGFASVGRDRRLRLWEPGGVQVFESPHPNSVKCVCANDERTALATGSYGGTVALFDLVQRRWRTPLRPTAAGISSIAWDGAARRFLAASYDGKVYPIRP